MAILDVHLHGESAFPVAEALIAKGTPLVFATTGARPAGVHPRRPILQKPFAKDDLARVLKLFAWPRRNLRFAWPGLPGLCRLRACRRQKLA